MTSEHSPKEQISVTDRYDGSYPDPDTVCKGPCEGMGCFPLYNPDQDQRSGNCCRPLNPESLTGALSALWHTAHDARGPHICDGYHFVTCPDCGGSGKRSAT